METFFYSQKIPIADKQPYNEKNIHLLLYSSLEDKQKYFCKHIFPPLQKWCKKWRLHLLEPEHYVPTDFTNLADHCHSISIAILLLDKSQKNIKDLLNKSNMPQNILSIHLFVFLDEMKNSLNLLAVKVKEDIQKNISVLFQQRLEYLWKQHDIKLTERHLHNLFAQEHTRFFVGRKNLQDRIFRYIEDDNSEEVLVLHGEEGIGKSALLAKIYKELENKYTRLLIGHFVGSSQNSISLSFLWPRICYELETFFKIEQKDMPFEKEKLAMLFRGFFRGIEKSTIILFDGVNDERWLPDELPTHIKMIVATRGSVVPHSQKKIKTIEIPPLQKQEIISMAKQLAPNLKKSDLQWLQKYKIKNPLYLKLILGEFATSLHKIPQCPQTIKEFFLYILKRLEKEFNPEVVKMLCCLVQSSQQGLTTKELQQLFLEIDENNEHQLILHQLSNYLYLSKDFIYFLRPGLSKAIEQKYLKKEKQHWQQFLAKFFQK